MAEIRPIAADLPTADKEKLDDGMALCLSGGGYRAMLFHVGAVLRLNELGLLKGLKRIASVSGGSITAGVLGMNWGRLQWNGEVATKTSIFQNFVDPIRKMAGTSVDVSAGVWGILDPFSNISDKVAGAYDSVLFHGKTLQDLPDEKQGNPRFVITATNVKTGSLWRFARIYMADYRVGRVFNPKIPLSLAVAASSAFPPFLSPMRFPLDDLKFEDNEPEGIPQSSLRSLRGEAVLTDGGVYDNLGLEPVWKNYKTVLVSDGGRKMSDDLSPADDWARHSRRLIDLLQHQVSNLRRRQLIDSFTVPEGEQESERNGAYWGIQTNLANYSAPSKLDFPLSVSTPIAEIPTRLTALSDQDQKRIVNWGYAVCDGGLRTHLAQAKNAAPPTQVPLP